MKNLLVLFISCLFAWSSAHAQVVYKTPSGKKYHLGTCQLVENVALALYDKEAVRKANLTPCAICNPPAINELRAPTAEERATQKSTGLGPKVRCQGHTKSGTRCKRSTRAANGYCFQHHPKNEGAQKPTSRKRTYQATRSSSTSSLCGARTKSGRPCRRKVKGGGYCYQHK